MTCVTMFTARACDEYTHTYIIIILCKYSDLLCSTRSMLLVVLISVGLASARPNYSCRCSVCWPRTSLLCHTHTHTRKHARTHKHTDVIYTSIQYKTFVVIGYVAKSGLKMVGDHTHTYVTSYCATVQKLYSDH